jgi:uncharacterized protein (TIGR02271 family)
MSRTITALFDSREEAEAAKARLQSSRIDADRIRVVDKDSASSSTSASSGGSGSGSGGESRGFFGSLADMFMPDEDRHAYQEGMNRGGYMVCAQVDEHEADEAVRVLEESNSIDFDERQEQWRGDGWAGWTGGTMNNQGVASSSPQMAAGRSQQQPQQQQQAFQAGGQAGGQMGSQMGSQESGRMVEEERIPLVQEELRVGKREVNRGGARVRSYVREVPVHEQVSLREEHVDVERRPVSGERLSSADASGLLQERTIEMTETAEEAVVAKEARVAEEVVVRKTAEQHNEQVSDTVRRTEVDVQEGVTGTDRSAFGFQGDRAGETGQMSESERAEFERTNNPAYRP